MVVRTTVYQNYFSKKTVHVKVSLRSLSVTMDIKQRQMVILKLLNHITEPLMYKDLVDVGKNFKIEENTESFTVSSR